MPSTAEAKLFEGTWALLQGQDDRAHDLLGRIVLRDGLAWYRDAPDSVGYYEVTGSLIVIGLPRGDAGLDLITARVLGDPERRQLSGVIESTDGEDLGICDPCVLLNTGERADRGPRAGREHGVIAS